MNTFQIWIRPLGDACRVRVEGKDNCKWLFSRLTEWVEVSECRDLTCKPDGQYTFNVPYGGELTTQTFTKMLRELPQIQLMSQPA